MERYQPVDGSFNVLAMAEKICRSDLAVIPWIDFYDSSYWPVSIAQNLVFDVDQVILPDVVHF